VIEEQQQLQVCSITSKGLTTRRRREVFFNLDQNLPGNQYQPSRTIFYSTLSLNACTSSYNRSSVPQYQIYFPDGVLNYLVLPTSTWISQIKAQLSSPSDFITLNKFTGDPNEFLWLLCWNSVSLLHQIITQQYDRLRWVVTNLLGCLSYC